MAALNYIGTALSDLTGGLGTQQQQMANALTAGSINMGDYATAYNIYSNDLYASGSSITISYPGATKEPQQDDGEESALEWLDRRVDEVCAEL